MNFEEMHNIWKDQPSASLQQVAENFTRRRIRRRRAQTLWLGYTFLWLLLITALAIRNVIMGKVDLLQQWTLVPLLGLPWVASVVILVRHLRPRLKTGAGSLTVTEALSQAQEAGRAEQFQLKWIAALLGLLAPILALTLRQLVATGKVSGDQEGSLILFLIVALLVGATAVALRYFCHLRPQQRQLSSLLAELRQD